MDIELLDMHKNDGRHTLRTTEISKRHSYLQSYTKAVYSSQYYHVPSTLYHFTS